MTRTATSKIPALILATLGVLPSCDNSQALHEPDFSWARMIEQPRAEPYGTTPAFPDGVAMRAPPPGTVLYQSGSREPVPVTRALLERGRDRFEVFCAACHGLLGDGNSVVATKMELRRPTSLQETRIRELSDARIEEVVTLGYGLMSSYAVQLPPPDRVAVVAYVRALQLSQNARASELPPRMRDALRQEAP